MATPDIRNLYEQFLQIYGGQGGSSDPARSEPQSQTPRAAFPLPVEAYGADDGYKSTGGVLGGAASSSSSIPSWAQAFSPGGIAAGPRGMLPFGPSILGRFLPMPVGRSKIVEIPNPHLERSIPQSARDLWTAATLLPGILRDHEQQESGPTSSRPDPNIRDLRKVVPGDTTSQSAPEESDHPLRLLLKGMYGDGATGDDAYTRCVKAAEGETDDWENFCRFLDRRQNNTVGGESQNSACWSQSLLSKNEKKNYCYNQFSKRQ